VAVVQPNCEEKSSLYSSNIPRKAGWALSGRSK